MAVDGNYTCFVHFVPERNILVLYIFEHKLWGGHANDSLENESFMFLSQ